MKPVSLDVSIVDRRGARLSFNLKPGMSVALIGSDGTGKTTAAAMLAEHLSKAGIACERHHWYRWFQAALFVPVAVLLNRRRKAAVKIFDRTIFDNLATWRLSFAGLAAAGIDRCYPRFDVVVYFVATPEAIVRRRPEIEIDDARSALKLYGEIGSALRLVALDEITVTSRAVEA